MASPWPIETIHLDRLVLDPANVRVRAGRGDGLVEAERSIAERAIVRYLSEAEDLSGLIRDILRDGYLDNEIPVVHRDGDQFVVLEGNRRIASLKVIAEPGLLAEAAAKAVERQKVRYSDEETPTSVRVMLAPSLEAAQPLLARLHTGTPKRGWLREQQAIFYHAQLDEDVTVDDLKARYPAEASTMVKKIRLGEMREVIRGLRYEDDDLRDFVMNSDLKMTSFEYAYQPKKISAALGLEFSRDGLLATKQMSGGQRRALMYLLARFKDGSLNTRSPELIAKNAEAHESFADEIRRIVAGEPSADRGREDRGRSSEESDPGSYEDGSDADESTGTSGEKSRRQAGGDASTVSNDQSQGSGPIPRGANRGSTKSRLDFEGLDYLEGSAGIRRRLEELKRIDVRDFPNAAHDVLRSVLECAIKDYFRKKNEPLSPGKTLGPCVEALARDFQGNQRMTTAINAINRRGRMSAEQFAGTMDSLSATNHEPDHFVEGADVHAAWERLRPIIVEISKPPSAA